MASHQAQLFTWVGPGKLLLWGPRQWIETHSMWFQESCQNDQRDLIKADSLWPVQNTAAGILSGAIIQDNITSIGLLASFLHWSENAFVKLQGPLSELASNYIQDLLTSLWSWVPHTVNQPLFVHKVQVIFFFTLGLSTVEWVTLSSTAYSFFLNYNSLCCFIFIYISQIKTALWSRIS